MTQPNIRYLKNKDINYFKWDQCVNKSLNGVIYGFSWYLNIVCNKWDALVENDYETVMPLPLTKILGYPAVYCPVLINQLGIFSQKPLPREKVSLFISAIPPHIKIINLNLNRYNAVDDAILKCRKIYCYELDSIKSYKKIQKKYSGLLKDELDIARKEKVSILRGISLKEYHQFLEENMASSGNPAINLKFIRMLISTGIRLKVADLYGAYSKHNNLCAVGFFMRSNSRLTLLQAIANAEGLGNKSINELFDQIIRSYAEKNLTMSFEYMDKNLNPGFYKSFGMMESSFLNIRLNKLPFYMKFLIR